VNPKVCVSISSTDTPELLGRAQRAERLSADLVEVRLDRLRSFHGLTKIARAVERPIIGTNRPLSEKGSFDRSEAERLKILMEAVEGGFQYVDLELTTAKLDRVIKTFRERGAKIILSHHDHLIQRNSPQPSRSSRSSNRTSARLSQQLRFQKTISPSSVC